MSIISKLIALIGSWFGHAADAGEKIYESLTEEEKKAINYASGIFSLISKYGEQALPYVQVIYPEITENVLQGFLDKWLKVKEIVLEETPLTLQDALKEVSTYINKFEGSFWVQEVQAGVNILAILFSPDTPIQKFINCAEYVYQLIVKPTVSILEDGPPTLPGKPCPPGQIRDPRSGRCITDPG